MNTQHLARKQQHALRKVFIENGIERDRRIPVRAFPGTRYISWRLGIKNPKQLKKALEVNEQLALVAGVENVISTRQRDVIRYDFALPPHLWTTYKKSDLKNVDSIGMIDPATRNEMKLGWAGHKIVAGMTGSGKTVAMQMMILTLIQLFNHQNLDLMIASPDAHDDFLDPKTGVDFSGVPHLIRPVAQSRDDIAEMISAAWRIFMHRKNKGLTEKNGKARRLAIFIDELQHSDVIGLNPQKTDDLFVMLQQLLASGRKYNIRLFFGTQEPSKTTLPNFIANIGDRWVGKVVDTHTSTMLTGLPGVDAHRLTGNGDFYHVENGSVVRFQVALPNENSSRLLPSGGMNPIPEMMEIAKDQKIDPEIVENVDWSLLGKMFAASLRYRRPPGSSMRKRWSVNPKKFKNHLIMFRNSPLREFLKGYVQESNYLMQISRGGTS